ncbi:hypothetical protein RFI_32867, partial [Reticulomyxa filosa]
YTCIYYYSKKKKKHMTEERISSVLLQAMQLNEENKEDNTGRPTDVRLGHSKVPKYLLFEVLMYLHQVLDSFHSIVCPHFRSDDFGVEQIPIVVTDSLCQVLFPSIKAHLLYCGQHVPTWGNRFAPFCDTFTFESNDPLAIYPSLLCVHCSSSS